MNPLFPKDDDQPKRPDNSYLLSRQKGHAIKPLQRHIVDDTDDQKSDNPNGRKTSGHAARTTAAKAAAQAYPKATKLEESAGEAEKGKAALPEDRNAAIELIRRKVHAVYGTEPNAKQEAAAITAASTPQRSKHQQFMYSLTTSGKPLAQIQTEWHNYYVSLPDSEKHEVWQEFYSLNSRAGAPYSRLAPHMPAGPAPTTTPPATPSFPSGPAMLPAEPKITTVRHRTPSTMADHQAPSRKKALDRHAISTLKKKIVHRVQANAKAQEKAKQHFQSLLFGLGTGAVVLMVLLFSFFNEVIIAPFIQPSRHVSATPIIINSDSVAASEAPEVIIPKINVQIPVIYGQESIKEEDVQRSLEDGIIHYPTTVTPGQQGNAAFFGHSSNNLFNKGKYKFAFVKLHELVPGDVFHLTYDKKVYSYRVFDKKVVEPSEISVLGAVPGKTATAALITCDPPGTSLKRLVVWGEQISPDPAEGVAQPATPTAETTQPTALPSEGPTLWGRFRNWLF